MNFQNELLVYETIDEITEITEGFFTFMYNVVVELHEKIFSAQNYFVLCSHLFNG